MRVFITVLMVFVLSRLSAQIPDSIYYAKNPDSAFYPYTFNLEPVVFIEQKDFKNFEERKQFIRTRFYVNRAYPLAQEALGLMRETDSILATIDRKRHQNKHLRKNYRKLKSQYKSSFKDMYVEEGRVLIKIIERETGQPFYDVIQQYRNTFDAEFWNKLAQIQGYSLKEGYDPKKEKMLERVLQSYEKEISSGEPLPAYDSQSFSN